jgi:TonB family protein
MKNFLFELIMVHVALIAGYWLLLKNEHDYSALRLYLIVSTLLSLIIPLLKFPKLFSTYEEVIPVSVPEPVSTDFITAVPTTDHSFWNDQILLSIYLIITGLFVFKFLGNICYIFYLDQKSRIETFSERKIRRLKEIQGSFTFFNWIFLSQSIDKSQSDFRVILKHEEAHVSLLHSFDLLLFELYRACFWWLPTAWIAQKEIKKIHEFQADAYALKSYDVSHYSSILISSTLESNGLSLASSFHNRLIFKRLKAMKHQTRKVSNWKVGSLSLLCALIISIFACTEDKVQAQDSQLENEARELFTIVEKHPSYEGGLDAFYSYAKNEIRYPSEARKGGIEGRVFVQFVIERNGSLSNIEVMKGIGGGCGSEVVRVLKNSGSFTAGSQRGRTVRTQMILPVTFKLDTNDDKKEPLGSIIIGEVQVNKNKLNVDVKYQDGAWQGTIKDSEGNPLPGTNIVVQGTSFGTVSDLDGTFTVKAIESQNVLISFIGYESILLESNKQ